MVIHEARSICRTVNQAVTLLTFYIPKSRETYSVIRSYIDKHLLLSIK